MNTIDLGYATIYCTAIVAAEGATRRQCEVTAVRRIVESVLGPEVRIGHDADGRPLIPGWHVSVTHSRRLAAVALSRTTEVGIDAEEWRPALGRVVSRYLSGYEQALFASQCQLLVAWTIKEAVYKVCGSEAYAYADAIAISPDMRQATVATKKYAVDTLDIDGTVLSIAHPLNPC